MLETDTIIFYLIGISEVEINASDVIYNAYFCFFVPLLYAHWTILLKCIVIYGWQCIYYSCKIVDIYSHFARSY